MGRLNRRKFLQSMALAACGAVSGSVAEANTFRMTRQDPEEMLSLKLALPNWQGGGNSASTDTMLMFRGNPSHTFYGTGPLRDKLEVVWKKNLSTMSMELKGRTVQWGGTGWTGQASKLGDYVFIAGQGGTLYAFDADSGESRWSFRGAGVKMYKSSLCIYDNKLYVGNVDNLVRCVDAETGLVLWQYNTSKDCDSSPCVADGKLYFCGENGHAHCLDPHTGELKWKAFLGGIGPGTPMGSNGVETSPAVADGELYAANYHGELFCLDASTGKTRWKANTGDDTDASPVLTSERVFIGAEDRNPKMFCFAREDGRELWSVSNSKGWWSTPAVVGDRLYVGGHDGYVYCLDALSGREVWRFNVGAAVWSSPAVVGGKVVFGAMDEHLYVVDAEKGRFIQSLKLGGRIFSTPCIVDGRVYIGTSGGPFFCLG